jgi:hypothetical protein
MTCLDSEVSTADLRVLYLELCLQKGVPAIDITHRTTCAFLAKLTLAKESSYLTKSSKYFTDSQHGKSNHFEDGRRQQYIN